MSYRLYENQEIKVPAGFTYTSEQLNEIDFFRPLFESTCAIDVDEAGYTTSFRQLDKLKEDTGLDFSSKSDQEAVDMINQWVQEQAASAAVISATLSERVEANAAAIEEIASALFVE